MKEINNIIRELDKWVSKHGDGKYQDPNGELKHIFSVPHDSGIHQVRKEIKAFVELILEKKLKSTVLEIGLGYYGSTHFLWRLIFDKIVTIECDFERVKTFGRNTSDYYGNWILDDGRSHFAWGYSYEPSTVGKIEQILEGKQIDLLFIDGNHGYNAVLTDWLLYNSKVRKGGIVAFHDCELKLANYFGVPQFLEKLENGLIDGEKRNINRIVFSKNAGIAWYKKD